MHFKKIAEKIKNYSPIFLLGLCIIYSTYIIYWLRDFLIEDTYKREGAILPENIFEQLAMYVGLYSFLIYPIVVLFSLFVIIGKLKKIEQKINSD